MCGTCSLKFPWGLRELYFPCVALSITEQIRINSYKTALIESCDLAGKGHFAVSLATEYFKTEIDQGTGENLPLSLP